MNSKQSTTLAAQLEAAFQQRMGAIILATTPNDEQPKRLMVYAQADKTVKLKDGSKGACIFVLPEGASDETTMVLVDAKDAQKLFNGDEVTHKEFGGTFKLTDETVTLPTFEETTTEEGAATDTTGEGDGTTHAAGEGEAGASVTDTAAADEKAAKKAADQKARDEKAAAKVADKAKKEAERKAASDKREAEKLAEKQRQEARKADKETNSKKVKALEIYNSVPATDPDRRKKVIAILKKPIADGGLDMGPAGANTYYQNMKSGHWKA